MLEITTPRRTGVEAAASSWGILEAYGLNGSWPDDDDDASAPLSSRKNAKKEKKPLGLSDPLRFTLVIGLPSLFGRKNSALWQKKIAICGSYLLHNFKRLVSVHESFGMASLQDSVIDRKNFGSNIRFSYYSLIV